MLFESLRHFDFDTFSHEMQTSQDPNFIFDTQLHIPHETLHVHTQQISICHTLSILHDRDVGIIKQIKNLMLHSYPQYKY